MPRLSLDERRSLLVDAAFRVIGAHGVEAATTRAICAEAQMPQASFHYAFTSRMELLDAVVETALETELTALTTHVDPGVGAAVSVRENFRRAMRGYVDAVVADPAREQAMLALAAYARVTPELHRWGAEIYDRYHRLALDLLSFVETTTGVTMSTSPHQLAPLAVAITDGITSGYLSTFDAATAYRTAEMGAQILAAQALGAPGAHDSSSQQAGWPADSSQVGPAPTTRHEKAGAR